MKNPARNAITANIGVLVIDIIAKKAEKMGIHPSIVNKLKSIVEKSMDQDMVEVIKLYNEINPEIDKAPINNMTRSIHAALIIYKSFFFENE